MLSISAVEGWVLTSFRLCRTQIHEHQGQAHPIPCFPIAESALPSPELPPQLPCWIRAKLRFRTVELLPQKYTWKSSHQPSQTRPQLSIISPHHFSATNWVLSHQPWSPLKFQAGFSSFCFSLENSPPGISPPFSGWFFLQCLTWMKSQTTGTAWPMREERS